MASRIEVQGLACRRDGRTVFARLSFSAGAGELIAVVGPNGVGKTSLLRCIAGLVAASAGTILYGGSDEPPPLHWLGHADALKPALTLADNLAFAAALGERPADRTRLAATAGRVGLAHALDLPARVLSAGQRRRAALARLLIDSRGIWLLDEPTAALDRDGEALLGALMGEHLAAGGAVVAATHAELPVVPARVVKMGVADDAHSARAARPRPHPTLSQAKGSPPPASGIGQARGG